MSTRELDRLLDHLDDPSLDLADTLRLVIDWLRPTDDRRNVAPVIGHLEALTLALNGRPSLQRRLRERLEDGLEDTRHLTLCTGIGRFSRKGFFRDAGELTYEWINPHPMNRDDLKDVLYHVFHDAEDAEWVGALPDDAWWRLFEALGCLSGEHPGDLQRAREEVLYALEMLSIWVAAEELEAELLRPLPRGLRRRLATWIGYNYGAVLGSFLFGVLLGTTGYVGYLLNLPLDIQHAAFASANPGFVTASEAPGAAMFMLFLAFVLLIGAVNLWVSFGLARYMALRARGLHIGAFRGVLRAYTSHLRQRPRDFLLLPRPQTPGPGGGPSDAR